MRVLVTDGSGNHALATVRSLGRKGFYVAAADSVRWAKSFSSRYCAKSVIYTSPSEGITAFFRDLCGILEELRPTMLMPMTERTILALLTDREAIESRVPIAPLPPKRALLTAFDKKATVDLACSLGVPVPRTFSFSSLPDFKGIEKEVTYPCVIKPTRSEIMADDKIVPAVPVQYCFRPEDLEFTYLAVHQRSPLPLIQEFIPGEGYGISVLCRHGEIRALFAHRRIRMVRPTGSGSSMRESIVPPQAMVKAARSLMEALRWHGVAMVEFKLDSRDSTPKLMEINGRFWNSLPLAVAAGVDFPVLLYRLGTEGDVPECLDYRVGVRCRWLLGDAKHLAEVLRGKPAGWADGFPTRWETLWAFMKFFERDLYYDDLWLSDPFPFFAEVADVLSRQLPEFLFRKPVLAREENTARNPIGGR